MTSKLSKNDLKAANQRFVTQRGRYLYLSKLGFSQAEIAGAYGVSKRAVWQGIHAAGTPREIGKLVRYRIPIRGRA